MGMLIPHQLLIAIISRSDQEFEGGFLITAPPMVNVWILKQPLSLLLSFTAHRHAHTSAGGESLLLSCCC